MPTLHVVADPNGCGKSTLTHMNGFGGLVPIDPDSILRGMVSGTPAQVAREALRLRRAALPPLIAQIAFSGRTSGRSLAI